MLTQDAARGVARQAMDQAPLLSIVIPTYNRERLLKRALQSCLSQDFTDYEIVVVDDGSTDGTARTVEAYAKPRLRLTVHAANQGVAVARNTGVDHAQGEWVLLLDSDDELLPGALGEAAGEIVRYGDAVDRIAYMKNYDRGGQTPDPPFSREILDYEGFARWLGRLKRPAEFVHVTRRSTFTEVRFPPNRGLEYLPYNLDFASRYLTLTCPRATAIHHTDALDQLTARLAHLLRRYPADHADNLDAILAEHGAVLRRHAPRHHRYCLAVAALVNLLAGRREHALGHLAHLRRLHPLWPKTWILHTAGLLWPEGLAQLMALRDDWLRYAARRRARPGRG